MLANYIVFDRANQQIGLAQSTGNCGTGSGACEDDQFMCTDGECIPGDFHGDNVTDCRDGSDEIATTGQGGTTPVSKQTFLSSKLTFLSSKLSFVNSKLTLPQGGPTTVPCVTLASPDHGAVAVNQVSRLATFQCDPGYVISSGVSHAYKCTVSPYKHSMCTVHLSQCFRLISTVNSHTNCMRSHIGSPLQNCLLTPELQWQPRCKRRILQGCNLENAWAI
jgi:hypothetical protein